jgi:hypothetical protein
MFLQVRKDIFRKNWTDIKNGDPTKSCTLAKKTLNFCNVFGPQVDRKFLDLIVIPMAEKDEEGVQKIEIGKQFVVNAKKESCLNLASLDIGISACTQRIQEILGDAELAGIVINKLWNEVGILRQPYTHK